MLTFGPTMEETMSSGLENEWEKELRVLLELVQSRPSGDWTRERERIAVLNNLIATQHKGAASPQTATS
jgi:hypothetical protein